MSDSARWGGGRCSVRPVGESSHGLYAMVMCVGQSMLSWLATPACADVFYYKDAEGVFHFTSVQRSFKILK